MLFVHPFAEEMNKSRRMAALQSRALADGGWTVLQMDLFGCGDSDGEFAEADWQQWISDIVDATAWLRDQSGLRPVLWGLRAGCLLVRAAAEAMDPVPDLVFWQPATSGKQLLNQFLRMGVTSQFFGANPSERIGTEQIRGRLAEGHAVEIGGYDLPPGIATGLDAATLTPLAAPVRVAWLEIAAAAAPKPSPVVQAHLDSWRAASHQVALHSVAGQAFWQTQEIAECPELLDATCAAVSAWRK